MENYVEQAQVTNTIDYTEGMGRLLLANILLQITDAGGALDALKKYQFYHRETEETLDLMEEQAHRVVYESEDYTDFIDFDVLFPGIPRERALKIYHGVIGKITEAVELAEMLRESLVEKKPVDLINLIEEVGDGQWYDASIADGLNMVDFSVFQRVNIDKLRKRFGPKFDMWKAQQENRPLEEERKLLEAGYTDPNKVTYEALDRINTVAVRGLSIVLSGPSGCGKGLAGDALRSLIPNAKIVESSGTESPNWG